MMLHCAAVWPRDGYTEMTKQYDHEETLFEVVLLKNLAVKKKLIVNFSYKILFDSRNVNN